MKNVIGILTLLFVTLGSIAQNSDTLTYRTYSKEEKEIPFRQTIVILKILPDSTYRKIFYTGEINDNKKEYEKWNREEDYGTWKIEKNKIIILKRGQIEERLKIKKRKLKYMRMQKMEKGFTIKHKRWIFEKKPIYRKE